jgi:hypothetical protein
MTFRQRPTKPPALNSNYDFISGPGIRSCPELIRLVLPVILRTCSKCGEEFELLPGKKGFANVCPTCTENPEDIARKATEEERLRKELLAANKANNKNREKTIREDNELKALGYEIVFTSRHIRPGHTPIRQNGLPK